MKNIIIVNAYINSTEKEDILFAAIQQLQKLHIKILLISNSTISPHIVELCDYYIYDKENFLLPLEHSPITWYADSNETIHLYNKGIGYTIIKKLNLSLHFVKNLEFDNFIFIEYDNIIHDDDLQKIEDIFSILTSKNAFICDISDTHTTSFETRIFAGNVDFFLNHIPLPRTFEQWIGTAPYMFMNETLELIFPILFTNHTDTIHLFKGYNKDYFINSKIDVFSIVKDVNLVYNTEDSNRPLLFILGQNKHYEIYEDDTLVHTVIDPVGYFKYYFDITTKSKSIKVKAGNKTQQYILDKETIEQYKSIGVRIKL